MTSSCKTFLLILIAQFTLFPLAQPVFAISFLKSNKSWVSSAALKKPKSNVLLASPLISKDLDTLDRMEHEAELAVLTAEKIDVSPFTILQEAQTSLDRIRQQYDATLSASWKGFKADQTKNVIINQILYQAFLQVQREVRKVTGPVLQTTLDFDYQPSGCEGDILIDRLIYKFGVEAANPKIDQERLSSIEWDFTKQVRCLSEPQLAALEKGLSDGYSVVVKAIADHQVGSAAKEAFLYRLEPLMRQVLDARKHRGRFALSYQWYQTNKKEISVAVTKHGFVDGFQVIDNIHGIPVRIPECRGANQTRCIDPNIFFDSVDPRAIGLGTCSLGGMVTQGKAELAGETRYTCPIQNNCEGSSSGVGGIGQMGPGKGSGRGLSSSGSATAVSGGTSFGGGQASSYVSSRGSSRSVSSQVQDSLNDRWGSGLSQKDINAMGSNCGKGSGFGMQGVNLTEQDKCNLGSDHQDPFSQYEACVADAIGATGGDVINIGSFKGTPQGKRCGLVDPGQSEATTGGASSTTGANTTGGTTGSTTSGTTGTTTSGSSTGNTTSGNTTAGTTTSGTTTSGNTTSGNSQDAINVDQVQHAVNGNRTTTVSKNGEPVVIIEEPADDSEPVVIVNGDPKKATELLAQLKDFYAEKGRDAALNGEPKHIVAQLSQKANALEAGRFALKDSQQDCVDPEACNGECGGAAQQLKQAAQICTDDLLKGISVGTGRPGKTVGPRRDIVSYPPPDSTDDHGQTSSSACSLSGGDTGPQKSSPYCGLISCAGVAAMGSGEDCDCGSSLSNSEAAAQLNSRMICATARCADGEQPDPVTCACPPPTGFEGDGVGGGGPVPVDHQNLNQRVQSLNLKVNQFESRSRTNQTGTRNSERGVLSR